MILGFVLFRFGSKTVEQNGEKLRDWRKNIEKGKEEKAEKEEKGEKEELLDKKSSEDISDTNKKDGLQEIKLDIEKVN